jgi:TolA-binding protein
MKQSERPSDYLAPELDEARLERQWSEVQSGLATRRWRFAAPLAGRRLAAPLAWGGSALALCAALLLGLRLLPSRSGSTLPDGALLGSAAEPVQLALDDGSTVRLDARSQVRVEQVADAQVELALLEGGASFDVTPNRARRFRVVADAVRVEVIGTRFRVTRSRDAEGLRVHVAVQRGVVEVGRSDRAQGVRRLLAGESWSASIGPAPSLPVAEPVPSAAVAEPRQPESEPEPSEPAPRVRGERAESAPVAPVEEHGPLALFSDANLARRAGRVAEAAAGYAELLQRHPGDERAGLSAFELGRLRMDALGDARGAVAALQRALAAPGNEAFREDAMARLVLAHDALHETAACQRAREQYLSRYPGGVHVAALSVRCAVK